LKLITRKELLALPEYTLFTPLTKLGISDVLESQMLCVKRGMHGFGEFRYQILSATHIDFAMGNTLFNYAERYIDDISDEVREKLDSFTPPSEMFLSNDFNHSEVAQAVIFFVWELKEILKLLEMVGAAMDAYIKVTPPEAVPPFTPDEVAAQQREHLQSVSLEQFDMKKIAKSAVWAAEYGGTLLYTDNIDPEIIEGFEEAKAYVNRLDEIDRIFPPKDAS
jgi:hypothetical protein